MSCCNAPLVTNEERYGVLEDTPCGSISIDLLTMFKRPIDCYLEHNLADKIGSNVNELQSASAFLLTFINQKKADPNDCTGISMLPIIRELVDKIIKKGLCL